MDRSSETGARSVVLRFGASPIIDIVGLRTKKPLCVPMPKSYGCARQSSRRNQPNQREKSFKNGHVSSTNGHVRPCNLKFRQRDLTPVLLRPVEPAVNSGPNRPETQLPLYARKRTEVGHPAISETCQTRKSRVLFDHFVGACAESWRDSEAEGLRRLEVYHQLEFGRLLNRQIGGLCAR
jgi:hypothetical protein